MLRKWMKAALAMCICSLSAGAVTNNNSLQATEDEVPIYEPKNLKDACEYMLTQAVSCAPKIRIRIKDLLTNEELKLLGSLLSDYRFVSGYEPEHAAKSTGSMQQDVEEGVTLFCPEYKSCVRILKSYRDPESIELTKVERDALKRAKEILEELGVSDYMTYTERALAIHDWIVANCAYDVEALGSTGPYDPDVYTPYDGKFMLLKNTGVCDSYAQAYWLLLQMANVPCSMMSGKMNKDDEGHAWNLVYLDDHWAHIDTTHDDPLPDEPERVVHEFFDKTDEEMEETRTWQKELFPNSEFTELFSSDNDILKFRSVGAFISFVNRQKRKTDREYTVEIAALNRKSKKVDEAIKEAAMKANPGSSDTMTSCLQDPLFPKAIRVKFHKKDNIRKH